MALREYHPEKGRRLELNRSRRLRWKNELRGNGHDSRTGKPLIFLCQTRANALEHVKMPLRRDSRSSIRTRKNLGNQKYMQAQQTLQMLQTRHADRRLEVQGLFLR